MKKLSVLIYFLLFNFPVLATNITESEIKSQQIDQSMCLKQRLNDCTSKCTKSERMNCRKACEEVAKNECRQAGE